MAYNKTTWKSGDKITAAKLNNIENGIAEVEESVGSELPTVTAADNGKVLGVDNGGYELIDNTVPLIVDIINDNGTFTTNKTASEILAADTAGRAIEGRYAITLPEGVSIVSFVKIEAIVISESETPMCVLIFSVYDAQESLKRKYYEMTADTISDVFSGSDSN